MIEYKQLNSVAKHGGIVFLGSSYLKSFPASELSLDFETDVPVYNRSIEGLTVDKACDELQNCVFDLSPSKVFINLGDEDIKEDDFNTEKFIDKYQWLLYMLHSNSHAKIYIVSVLSNLPCAHTVNESLKKLAKETGCEYVDASAALKSEKPSVRLFDVLRFYMRTRPMSFTNAMMSY